MRRNEERSRALAGLFVRIPRNQAESLDRLAIATGRAKQHLVSEMLAEGLADDRNDSEPASVLGDATDDVLTLSELTALLRLEPAQISGRLERGEVPGRVFLGEWRFSRRAILGWLGEPEAPTLGRRTAGFTEPGQ